MGPSKGCVNVCVCVCESVEGWGVSNAVCVCTPCVSIVGERCLQKAGVASRALL